MNTNILTFKFQKHIADKNYQTLFVVKLVPGISGL